MGYEEGDGVLRDFGRSSAVYSPGGDDSLQCRNHSLSNYVHPKVALIGIFAPTDFHRAARGRSPRNVNFRDLPGLRPDLYVKKGLSI